MTFIRLLVRWVAGLAAVFASDKDEFRHEGLPAVCRIAVRLDDQIPSQPITAVTLYGTEYTLPVPLATLAERAPELRSLTIRYGNLHQDDKYLDLVRFNKLESLTLVFAGFRDEHASEVRKLTRLRNLTMRAEGLFDPGLKIVGTLPHLELLDINGTQVSDDGLEELRKARPSLVVKAGNRNSAKRKIYRHFDIPKTTPFSDDAVRAAVFARFPKGTPANKVYADLGQRGLRHIDQSSESSYWVADGGKIHLCFRHDRDSGHFVRFQYNVSLVLDKAGKLVDAEITGWGDGP